MDISRYRTEEVHVQLFIRTCYVHTSFIKLDSCLRKFWPWHLILLRNKFDIFWLLWHDEKCLKRLKMQEIIRYRRQQSQLPIPFVKYNHKSNCMKVIIKWNEYIWLLIWQQLFSTLLKEQHVILRYRLLYSQLSIPFGNALLQNNKKDCHKRNCMKVIIVLDVFYWYNDYAGYSPDISFQFSKFINTGFPKV